MTTIGATVWRQTLATLTPIRRAHAELHAASPWPWNASELVDGWWLDGFAGVRAFPATKGMSAVMEPADRASIEEDIKALERVASHLGNQLVAFS